MDYKIIGFPRTGNYVVREDVEPFGGRFLVVNKLSGNVYADPNKVSAELVDRYYDLTLREGNRQALVDRFKQISANDSEKVKQLTMPTLILWGKQDQLIPVEYAQHFQQDIKGSQLVVFDNLGHVPHEEDPQQTVSAVMKFLAL